jgi:hypothetical protein
MKEEEIGPKVEFAYSQWCVFCDRGTGEVMHIHEYLMSSPDEEIPPEELVEQARRAVGNRLRAERIRVIHPPKGMRLDPSAIYAVDVQEDTLFVASKQALSEGFPSARNR